MIIRMSDKDAQLMLEAIYRYSTVCWNRGEEAASEALDDLYDRLADQIEK